MTGLRRNTQYGVKLLGSTDEQMSDQCPSTDGAVNTAAEAVAELDPESRVIEFGSAQEAQDSASSAYGTFSIVYDGKLLSYYSLLKEQLLQRLARPSS